MGNVFRVINCDGDIEISIYKKANAVFKTNEYKETEDICIEKEIINIFDLLKENQELKLQLKGTTHCFDEEEHEKLKKQVEEYKKQVDKGLYNTCLPYTTGYNKAIEDKETQQKEFIKYLEDNYKETQDIWYIKILQKYRSIIGVSDDKTN